MERELKQQHELKKQQHLQDLADLTHAQNQDQGRIGANAERIGATRGHASITPNNMLGLFVMSQVATLLFIVLAASALPPLFLQRALAVADRVPDHVAAAVPPLWLAIWLAAWVSAIRASSLSWPQRLLVTLYMMVLLMKQYSFFAINNELRANLAAKIRRERVNAATFGAIQSNPESDPMPTSTSAQASSQAQDKSLNSDSNKPDRTITNLDWEPRPDPSHSDPSPASIAAKKSIEPTLSPGPNKSLSYPENLTLTNYLYWLAVPSLVYQPSFAQIPHFRPKHFAYYAVWTLISFVGLYVAFDHYAYKAMLAMPTNGYWSTLISILPISAVYTILSFLMVFEYFCNAVAELTRFAHRDGFYGDFWNSKGYEDFSRSWAKIVHLFLHRHVYLPARHHLLGFTRPWAMVLTFAVSAAMHELVMFTVLGGDLRVDLFRTQLLQVFWIWTDYKLPPARPSYGMMSFWAGYFIGPAMLGMAYASEYFSNVDIANKDPILSEAVTSTVDTVLQAVATATATIVAAVATPSPELHLEL
eukprot:jgi/Hompol1/965/HPOL_005473-RA